MKRVIGVIAAIIALTVANVGAANAAPGKYTIGGNVAVIVSTSGCATIKWPKGYEHEECGTTTVIQGPIYSGDRFGAEVTSYSGYRVACRVIDVTTGDVIYSDYASGYLTANCIRRAN